MDNLSNKKEVLMQDRDLISVIVPAYNSQNTIRYCLDSIINQQECKFEIIVIDDGSKDDTLSIIKEYEQRYEFIHCIHKDNEGVSKARNVGMDNASGKYIYFVDSDDCLENSCLSKLLMTQRNNNCDLVASEIIDKKGTSKSKDVYGKKDYFLSLSKKTIGENMFFIRMGSAVGKLYLKNKINNEHIRFDETIGLAEDLIFVHKYLMACTSIAKVGDSVYLVNNLPSSLSKRFSHNIEKVVREQNNIYEECFSIYPEYKDIFYEYEMNYSVSGIVMLIKNMYLEGSPYRIKTRIKKIAELYRIGLMQPLDEMTCFDGPKYRIDKIYCAVLKTHSPLLVEIFFFWRENARRLKTRFL